MEQEEKDTFVTTYDESSQEPRRIMRKFGDRISKEVVGPHGKEWLKTLDLLSEIELPTQKLLDVLEKLLPKSAGDLYSLAVDYDRSVADGIRAGRYDYVNSDITARHFRTERTGVHEVRVELLHLDRDASTEEVLAQIDTQGYRPADLHELLAFGEKHPEIQREFPVVALGSVWRRRARPRSVPYLVRVDSERYLDLDWRARDWDAVCRFLVVRK